MIYKFTLKIELIHNYIVIIIFFSIYTKLFTSVKDYMKCCQPDFINIFIPWHHVW